MPAHGLGPDTKNEGNCSQSLSGCLVTDVSAPSEPSRQTHRGVRQTRRNLDRDEDGRLRVGKQAPVTPEIAEDDGKKEVKAADPEESVAATPKDPSPWIPGTSRPGKPSLRRANEAGRGVPTLRGDPQASQDMAE